jgi:enamine deaminase RidA (YjgF/YER057c/UK114 family)
MHSTADTPAHSADHEPLPQVTPKGTYRLLRRSGDLLYLSGLGPMQADGSFLAGKVGGEVSVKEAYQHARLVGRLMLAALTEAGIDLDRVEVIKVLGMVNATSDFGEHPAVINGCSDLLAETLGARGEHARSAVGVGSLPHNMTVEIEAIFRLLA